MGAARCLLASDSRRALLLRRDQRLLARHCDVAGAVATALRGVRSTTVEEPRSRASEKPRRLVAAFFLPQSPPRLRPAKSAEGRPVIGVHPGAVSGTLSGSERRHRALPLAERAVEVGHERRGALVLHQP